MLRKQISLGLLVLTALLLTLGTFSPLFKPLLQYLPPRSDLLFHLLAHAVGAACAAQLLAPAVPPEAVCAASVALAFLLELAQVAFVPGRSADPADAAAATVGSFAAFLVPQGGRLVRPSWATLMGYLWGEEEDDDDDGHRVSSWAV